jgi:copper(I)-binding protein
LGVNYLLNEGNITKGTTSFTTKIGVADSPRVCIFNPSGTPSSGGTVTIKNKNNQYLYVIVNPVAGRVRISDTYPDNW